MESQSYSNHVRVHPLYHYTAVPITLGLVVAAIINGVLNFSLTAILLIVASIFLHVAIFLARDYAKKNQDRIIRAELRLRYFILKQQRFEELEKHLSFGQLAALRFASDEEFIAFTGNPDLIKMQPDQIKKQIIQWDADTMRV
jgi:1,4-dihydroxy-2-naphthoate octaprenyltransferase